MKVKGAEKTAASKEIAEGPSILELYPVIIVLITYNICTCTVNTVNVEILAVHLIWLFSD